MCLTALRAKAGGDRFVFYSAFGQPANLTRCTHQSPSLEANKLLLLLLSWSKTPRILHNSNVYSYVNVVTSVSLSLSILFNTYIFLPLFVPPLFSISFSV